MSIEIPLVQEIKKHECLYNFNLPEYNRKDILEQAWIDISKKLNLTVYECKDKWKNIRSSYLRSLKFSGKLKKPYYLSSYLKFVLPFLKPTSLEFTSTGELPSNNEECSQSIDAFEIKIEQDSENEQIAENPLDEADVPIIPCNTFSVSRKRRHALPKRQSTYNAIQKNKHRRIQTPVIPPSKPDNSMRYFLLSLLPEFETMDLEQVRLFKIKIMMLIDDIKNDSSKLREGLPSQSENEQLQKRLINLLLMNLEKTQEIS